MKGRPGILRHRLTVQANTPAASDYGENAESWADLETVWGEVLPLSSGERSRAGQPIHLVSHKILLRYRDDLGAGDVEHAPKYRIQYDGRTFEVVALREIAARTWLELLAREVAQA